MLLPTTEMALESEAIDAQSASDALSILLDGQRAALSSVEGALGEIERGAEAMASAIRVGGKLVYAAAGSSGLMVVSDACELPGTFGIPKEQLRIHMAGGIPVDGAMPGDTEDDTTTAREAAKDIGPCDAVIVVSASGTTPFALALADCARTNGATLISIANNPATPLLEMADVAICLETPAEVIAGSTRLGAGTAQKAALNLMSSLMGTKLGHVYQGMMVNVVADNAKLVRRATGIVAQIAGVSVQSAEAALDLGAGNPKVSILIAKGCSVATARELLVKHEGHLGPCLKHISTKPNKKAN